MPAGKGFRTSVVRGAAIAVQECFQSLNIRWAIYGDLAWHLLCGSPTGGSWQLDVHVMGDSTTLAYASQRLASMDRRISLKTQVIDSITTMSYDHDVLNDGSSLKKHTCKIILICGPSYRFFVVKNLPLLPIQVILYRFMKTYSKRSGSRVKNAMAEVIAISEAYLGLPDLPPSVWSLTPAEQPLFVDNLAKITAIFPEAAGLFARLHPSSLPPIELVPPFIEPPVLLVPAIQSTEVVETSSLLTIVKERKRLSHSEAILVATHALSSYVRQLGHECFLAGTAHAPWYILGSPVLPTNHRVDFLVLLRNGKSLDWLQRTLCKQGILNAKNDVLKYTANLNDGESKNCKVTFEQLPSSMGLRPEEPTGMVVDGISVINPSYLLSILLSSVSTRGLPMKPGTYKNVSAALELLHHRNTNVRAAFGDASKLVELDQLACVYVAAHPEFRGKFAAIGFSPAPGRTLLDPLPPVDIRTTCGHTPPVQIPVIAAKGGVVFQAAIDAISLLRDSAYSCAIFGSAACYLYGNERLPNDVDILVSSEEGAEVIKGYLVSRDPHHFYLKKARTPGATYRVLWYRNRQKIGEKVTVTRQSKVDIVMAGTMMLPLLSSRSTIVKEALPLVPLEILLLHKLQGWHDHMTASEPHKQKKQTVDVADVRRTLKIVLQSAMGTKRSWARVALSFFQEEFQHFTMDRVKLFCSAFPDCRDDWFWLGFEVA
ncbi:hypothetical protein EDD18DRAFT_1358382 [Armillaria luteobubalina]|uniref:Uncharacterized protein n=1 Tax=Armillaria luteobubalina TaxID=153913 RepID=A0AA39PWP4_9AGAR|nr:hypothetical protein EDD18DRAFT_1358382 [Armillaria luteobubalina]